MDKTDIGWNCLSKRPPVTVLYVYMFFILCTDSLYLLKREYSFTIRNWYNGSNIWEGPFIDISGSNLCRSLTVGNIYWLPHDNNNNGNIQQFISEFSPIIDMLQSKNTYTVIVGDFNINLLKISERDKFGESFNLMCTNNFFPKITFPTRFAKHSCSLIDQIFCKTPHKKTLGHFVIHIDK